MTGTSQQPVVSTVAGETLRPSTAQKRVEILQAAMEVFGNKGYSNGTLADIADQVGMTHAGVLHHFGSKERLLLDVLNFRDDTDVKGLAEEKFPIGPESFEHLVSTAVANSQRAGIVQVFTVLSAESVTDHHPAKEYFQERYAKLRSELAQAFEVTFGPANDLQNSEISAACAAILAVMDGLQLQWLLAPESIDLGAMTEFAIHALVEAVRPAQPATTSP